MSFDLARIQKYLSQHELDGWLLADFHARNTIAVELLGLTGIVTRRSFYFIPAEGEPTALVHAIEKDKFEGIQGKQIIFSGYKELEEKLAGLLSECDKVAMEYSPKGRLPYIGLVDAGTIELIKGLGIEVVTSADLVASFQAVLSVEQIALHRMAANNLIEIKDAVWKFIRDSLSESKAITEYDVVSFMQEQFSAMEMTAAFGPNCSVDGNAGNPHYEPVRGESATIRRGQLILIDLWAKVKQPGGVYGDITWMAFTGGKADIPARYKEIFGVLVKARDEAVSFLRAHIDARPVHGWEVDDAVRKVVVSAGYGDYFIHRTGHSITTSEHGTGPNIDNLETEDTRRLQQGHLFSIEPGIYMKDCGFRTEINVLIGHNGVDVTTMPLQTEITPLF
jgi:Xaa-Pro dipeptidase